MLRVACQRPRTDNLSRTFSRQIHASKTLFHPLSFFGSAKASPIGAAPPSWKNAVLQAEELVQVGGSVINPKELLGRDISLLTENIRRLLGSGHPVLNTISTYYFSEKGKHIRPIIVLLMAQATNLSSMGKQSANPATEQEINLPISDASQSILFKPAIESLESSESIMPAQRRLAEITEMIHTASLLHDDVIDVSMTRRGSATANAEFGNKMAVLAGDFLLARASVALARLRNVQVVELLATVISNLVEGEIMQLRNSAYDNTIYKWQEPGWCPPGAVLASDIKRFEYYMEKTYMKTASLIAKSSRAATVLGGCSREISNAAYIYGRNLGLAFQLIDDLLDFVVTEAELGKPVNADLQLGLATAPILYASEMYPELIPLMERKFKNDGDVTLARKLVIQSNGIEQTRALAASYCKAAIDAISIFPDSPAHSALVNLTRAVLNRTT